MRKRIPIYFALIMLFPIGLLMLFSGSIVQIRGAMKYRQQGPLVKDFAAEKIPDNENAAIIYAQAFKEMPVAATDKDSGILSKFLQPTERDKDPKLWDEVRVLLPKYNKSLAIAEKAVLRSKCQFPIDWSDPITGELPHLPKLRRLANVLYAKALIDARDGRMDRACYSLLLGLQVTNALQDGPPSLSTPLLRCALTKTACRTIRELPEYGQINESQINSLLQTLEKINIDRTYVRAMKGERAAYLWAFDQYRNARWGESPSTSNNNQKSKSSSSVLWRFITWKDEAVYAKYMEQQLSVTHMRYRDAKRKGLLKEPEYPKYALMSSIMLPVAELWAANRDFTVAEIAGTQIFLNLHLHHNLSGIYPASLEDMSKKLPEDPFSGKSFIYKRQGKGFVLYSIGPNMKDDNGIQTPNHSNTGDIVLKADT